MASVPVDKVRECQDSFLDVMRSSYSDVIDFLGSGKIDDSATATIEKVMADVSGQYAK
jgi:F-type H+-transporting ATPase subunit alpha